MKTLKLWIKQYPIKSVCAFFFLSIAIWLSFSALLYWASPMLIYKPQDSKTAIVNVPYEQLWLVDHKNRKIDTLWFDNPSTSQIVIYLHGNRGRLSHFFPPMVEKFKVLAPAYPGYHQSEGRPSNADVYSTALLAYDYLLTQGYAAKDIILFGHSLGGSSAVYTAAKRPMVGKLVIVNTFNSLYDMCKTTWGIGCIFGKSLFNTATYAPSVYTEVRQFHDKNDTVVPYAQGEKLFSHFTGTENKKFITLPAEDSHSEFDIAKILATD